MSDEQEQIEELSQLAIDMRNQRDRAREERDELMEKYRVHHEEAERLTSEIDEAREQRDRMAEALRDILNDGQDHPLYKIKEANSALSYADGGVK